LKILHVITQLAEFLGDAGQLVNISRQLNELGHEVTIITTDGDYFFADKESSKRYSERKKELEKACKNPILINNVKVTAIHCSMPSIGMYCPNAKKIANDMVKEFDVIHVFSWYNHICMEFAKAAKQNKVPYFITTWASLNPGAKKIKKKRKMLMDLLYSNNLIKDASGLHSIGESETKAYLKMGAKEERIHRIDNGVILENFKITEKIDIFKKFGVKKNTPYILYLGRIDEKKGIEILLESFKEIKQMFPETILVLAGFGNDEYVQKIKKLVKKLSLEKVVRITGYVTEQEKLECYKHAQIFTLTSKDDIRPRAVQDALTMGIPVLITENCDYPEVEEYNAGRIVKFNKKDVEKNMIEMLQNKNELLNQSENAKKLINEKFLLYVQIKKYDKMYKNALGA
jgi:glycosyltransferase involved in cell wall biosynthesis